MAFTLTVAALIAADTSGLLGKHPTWERVPLADVASILNGAPFDSALFSSTDGLPLVRIRDVIAGETDTYFKGAFEDAYLVRQGDLLVGMDGDFNSGFWGARTALLNQRVCKISPTDKFYDHRLLALALPGYLAAINANTPSVTVKHLSSKTIGEIGLPLPPREEQTRIVAKLEALLSDLDAGVAELNAAKKKLTQYRQSMLKAAVEGALTAEWRAQHRPTETGAELLQLILAERRARWEAKLIANFKEQGKKPPTGWQQKYPEPASPAIAGLPNLPNEWVWASTDQTTEVVSGFAFSSADFCVGGVPVTKIANIGYGVYVGASEQDCLPESFVAIHREFIVSAGDLLIALTRPITSKQLKICRYPTGLRDSLLNQRVAALRPIIGGLTVLFYFAMRAPYFLADVRKSTSETLQPNMSPNALKVLAVPIPSSLEETKVIVEVVTSQLAAIDGQLRDLEHALKQSTAQRQNILRAAFAGQLVPQDPNDEPASVLLARIRAERAGRALTKKPRGQLHPAASQARLGDKATA